MFKNICIFVQIHNFFINLFKGETVYIKKTMKNVCVLHKNGLLIEMRTGEQNLDADRQP